MSTRSWILIVAVIAGGILLQIPAWGGHAEHHPGDGHEHAAHGVGEVAPNAATSLRVELPPGARRVDLEVTGMT